MSTTPQNLLGEPVPTQLTENAPAAALLAGGTGAEEVARAYPAYSLAWAMLAEESLAQGRDVEAYAYARVGYHRGLDLLRGHGWKGHGPIPWEHVPNRGFLRALAALAKAATAIGEDDEQERCTTFLADSSTTAAQELGLG